MLTSLLVVLFVLALVAAIYFARVAGQLRSTGDEARGRAQALENRFRGIVDADAEAARILANATSVRDHTLAAAQAESQQITAEAQARLQTLLAEAETLVQRNAANADESTKLQQQLVELRQEVRELDEEATLQSFGFYKPHYDFPDSSRYQVELDSIRSQQARMISDKSAAVCDTKWHVGGSAREGQKMVGQYLRLMLRAFNGECDAAIAKVKYNNVNVMSSRIRKAAEAIDKLGSVMQCRLNPKYVDFRLRELFLVHEHQEKVYEEKEEQRRIREQMREEEIALREFEKAQREAEKEEQRYADALQRAREEVETAAGAKQEKLRLKIEELEKRLAEAHERKERAIARAQMTRSGHVYVISNIGSFGEHVYKIGMTRRLDPMDRIRELGDASVPFQFDVHAIIYTDDAPALENTLHRRFGNRRINRVNERKEFFRATIDEIADAVRANHGEIELTRLAEAEEFRKTIAMIRAQGAPGDIRIALPPHPLWDQLLTGAAQGPVLHA
jgi:predicted nuclease with TOPRIM domain